MFKYKTLGGFNYTKQSYQDFYQDLNILGATRHELGHSYDGHPIVGFSVGNLRKPMFLIESIHGAHEWRTPYWLKRFMEIVVNEESIWHKKYFKKIKSEYCLFVIPTINPDGFENNTRFNGNGVDLNRNFDLKWEEYEHNYSGSKGSAPFSEPESRIVRDLVFKYKPVLFVDCHTWGGGSNPIFEISTRKHELLFKDTIKSFKFTKSINPFIYREDSTLPKSSMWVGRQEGRLGTRIISTLYESGELIPEYNQAKEGMDALMILIINAMNYFETHELISHSLK